jgi:hypothetical protein
LRPAFREYLQRARTVPPLLARSAWRYLRVRSPAARLEAFAALGRAIPTGVFDNEAIHEYLETVFTQPGRTNDFPPPAPAALSRRDGPGHGRGGELRSRGPRPRPDLEGGAGERRAAGPLPAGGDRRSLVSSTAP